MCIDGSVFVANPNCTAVSNGGISAGPRNTNYTQMCHHAATAIEGPQQVNNKLNAISLLSGREFIVMLQISSYVSYLICFLSVLRTQV